MVPFTTTAKGEEINPSQKKKVKISRESLFQVADILVGFKATTQHLTVDKSLKFH